MIIEFQSHALLFVTSTSKAIAQKATYVHSGTQLERKLLCVNIGCEDFVKKEMNVNFSMSMTCQRCLNAISLHDLVTMHYLLDIFII